MRYGKWVVETSMLLPILVRFHSNSTFILHDTLTPKVMWRCTEKFEVCEANYNGCSWHYQVLFDISGFELAGVHYICISIFRCERCGKEFPCMRKNSIFTANTAAVTRWVNGKLKVFKTKHFHLYANGLWADKRVTGMTF